MSNRLLLLVSILILSCNQPSKQDAAQSVVNSSVDSIPTPVSNTSFLTTHPLKTLLRKTPVEIGCLLETEFQYRDSLFNCDNKNYVNKGDPCKKTDEYYEGIKIPDELIKKISTSFSKINLAFEHGNLREITITFQDSLLKDSIPTMFNLPKDKKTYPDNITNIDYGDAIYAKDKPINLQYTKWLIITGFDHVGAGDVDCK